MTRIDLRTRLLGRLIGLASVTRRSVSGLCLITQRWSARICSSDLLLGGLARGVKIRDTTVAGADGTIPVRTLPPVHGG
jgi:hypothetical protein